MRPASGYHQGMNTRIPSLLLLAAVVGCGAKPTDTPGIPVVQPTPGPILAGLRGLCVVNADIAWASGTDATVLRTTDGGNTWTPCPVPGADDLDFRDVEAFGDRTAYILAAGPGDKSRIYKTTDAGSTWKLQFTNPDPKGFFDALAFWDEQHGLALGDPVDGRFQLLATDDGGEHWTPLSADDLPLALKGESVFAASGTCLIARGENDAWFVTGGKAARVFHSTDRGKSWLTSDVPIACGPESAGCFSIAFRDDKNGVIVGGDYKSPNVKGATGANAAVTTDGGKTWSPAKTPTPFRSCVSWSGKRWVAVGASGLHASDDGLTWSEPYPAELGPWNSVAFAAGHGLAAGPKGRTDRIDR